MREMEKRVRAYQVGMPPETHAEIFESLARILRSGSFVLGHYTEEFEKRWAEYTGRKYAVAVSSDSAALEIALRLLDVSGKIVLLPAMTFFAVLEAVYRAEGIPVLVDSCLGLSGFPSRFDFMKAVEKHHNKIIIGPNRVGAVIAAYNAGVVPPDIDTLVRDCAEDGIPVIEDCAHCHGTSVRGKVAGSFGEFGCWSFFATKVITTLGEGGMIATDNEDFAERARWYRNYGRPTKFGSGEAGVRGFNYRMTEIQAAAGCAAMRVMPSILNARRRIAWLYSDLLRDMRLLERMPLPEGSELGYYKYIVLLDPKVSKKEVKQRLLRDFGIEVQSDLFEIGLHQQPLYPTLKGYFPQAEEWSKRHLCLPIYEGMAEDDVRKVVWALKAIEKELLP
jgi:dTDP-4-amino-4,6-dideoxygalactose transaminase